MLLEKATAGKCKIAHCGIKAIPAALQRSVSQHRVDAFPEYGGPSSIPGLHGFAHPLTVTNNLVEPGKLPTKDLQKSCSSYNRQIIVIM